MESINRVFFSVISEGCRVQSGQFQIQLCFVEVALCSIVEVRGVVLVVQNRFTEILNPSRSSTLYEVAKSLSDDLRWSLLVEYSLPVFSVDVEFEAAVPDTILVV